MREVQALSTSFMESLAWVVRRVRVVFWLLVAVLALSPLASAQDSFDDVPLWAQEAIALVKAKGLFIGYPDGTFRWRDPATRAELAMVIYRLITTYGLTNLNPKEILLLREAVSNLSRELAQIQDQLKSQNLLPQIEALKKALELAAQRQDLEQLVDEVNALEERVKALESAPRPMESRSLEKELQQLAQLSQRVEQLEKGVADNAKGIEALQEVVNQDRELFQKLLTQAKEQAEAALRAVEEIRRALGKVEERLGSLERRLGRVENQLLPSRDNFYIGLGAYYEPLGGGEFFARGFLGLDRLAGSAIGVRLDYDLGLRGSGSTLGASLVYRMDFDGGDGYLGAGLGYRLESNPVPFGEIRLGLSQYFGAAGFFTEGAYRQFFSSPPTGGFSVASGLKFRF